MSSIFSIENLKQNTWAIVTKCSLPDAQKLRFFEMGLTVGAKVKLLKTAPLGDPLQIEVKEYCLCIKKAQARAFEVKMLEG